MRRRFERLWRSPLVHPLLFAAYPVVFLWSQNRGNGVRVGSVIGILALMVMSSAVIYALLKLLLHDGARAGIATTLFVLLFATFGHVEGVLGTGFGTIEDSGLLLAWLLLAVVAVVLARGIRAPERGTRPLNLIAAFLVGINVVYVVPALAHSGPVATARWDVDPATLDVNASGPPRDVYYLIFDRYAGAETLKDLYGYDNSAFLSGLRSRGFTVIDDALANYPQTTHSLVSSLNMTYLDDLASTVGTDSSDWTPLFDSFSDPAVARAFHAMGYRYEHVGSWWSITSADVTADRNFLFGGVPEFGQVFLGTTIVPALAYRLGISALDFERQAYDRIGFQVHSLRTIAQERTPTFTFAHFLLPHPPYVFRADGSYTSGRDDRPVEEAYLDQLTASNEIIDGIVDMLLHGPGPAPIIVLQSDEGPHPPALDGQIILRQPWSESDDTELGRKLRILNAYYLPGLKNDGLYRTITPVNTFRLILNDYFGTDLALLPDRTYIYTDYGHPFRFEDVTDRLREPG